MQLHQRQRLHFFVYRIGVLAGIQCEDAFQFQIFEGDVHGFGHDWCVRVFGLKAATHAAPVDQQIKFSPGVRRPEVGIAITGDSQHLLQRKPFPRRAEFDP